MSDQLLTLTVRRTIRATPRRLFEAWTRPEHLMNWWGPRPVKCSGAEVDLRVGGAYRIGNLFPDGSVLWIHGEFEIVEPYRRLVYSWLAGETPPLLAERVTVQFEGRGATTEVIITHERIPDPLARGRHQLGWEGCLDGLTAYFNGPARYI